MSVGGHAALGLIAHWLGTNHVTVSMATIKMAAYPAGQIHWSSGK